jgi:chemotaxis protein methyltransferase CheR
VSPALEEVAALLRRETGISLKPSQHASLAAALRRVDPALDAPRFLRVVRRSGAHTDLLDRLIEQVTVNETFFFRQRSELDAIEWRPLHDAVRASGRDTIRVWVAACASGEEAYTLATMASEAFAPVPPPVSILGTDISAVTLERARRGRYGRRSIRPLLPELRDRYFVPDGDAMVAGDRLRALVEFMRHNLVLDPPPLGGDRPFDLIACRNVLIYFDSDAVERVIESLERSLAPHGMLVLGAADRLCGSARRLARLHRSQAPAPQPIRAAPLRRPLGREPVAEPSGLAEALAAANAGDLEAALRITEHLLKDDPLDADAYFVRALAELGLDDERAAIASLRRSLYVDPSFGLAAFQLGRAYERLGDARAAARAYDRALRTLDESAERHRLLADQVDLGDVAGACAIRLETLRATAAAGGRR